MDKLNSSLESFLKEISPYSGQTNGLEEAISNRSAANLLQKNAYLDELKELKFIKMTDTREPISSSDRIIDVSEVYFPPLFTLTSKGETYFTEIQIQKEAAAKKDRRDRRWQIATIIISVLLSAIVGLIAQAANKQQASNQSEKIVYAEGDDARQKNGYPHSRRIG